MFLLALAMLTLAVPAASEAKKGPGKPPTKKLVKTSIGPVLDAQYSEAWMAEDQVTVAFKKIVIGKAKRIKSGVGRFDPMKWAWPVKADIVVTICRTPGQPCEEKRHGYWTRNVLGQRDVYWFDRFTTSGGWQWETSSEA